MDVIGSDLSFKIKVVEWGINKESIDNYVHKKIGNIICYKLYIIIIIFMNVWIGNYVLSSNLNNILIIKVIKIIINIIIMAYLFIRVII